MGVVRRRVDEASRPIAGMKLQTDLVRKFCGHLRRVDALLVVRLPRPSDLAIVGPGKEGAGRESSRVVSGDLGKIKGTVSTAHFPVDPLHIRVAQGLEIVEEFRGGARTIP